MNHQYGKSHLIVIIFALVAIVAGLMVQSKNNSKTADFPETPSMTLLPTTKKVASAELTDYNGRTITSDDFAGKWTLLFFGFTHCPDICPTTLQALKQIKQKVSNAGKWAPYQVAFISVDPKRDTPEQLANYIPYFDAEFIGLTGEDAAISAYTKELGILYIANEPDANGNYNVDHSAGIVLLNNKAEMAGFLSAPHDIEQISQDLIKLADKLEYSTSAASMKASSQDVQKESAESGTSKSNEETSTALALENAWIRPAPPGASAMAGYATISNPTDSDIILVGAESPQFDMAMIHDTVIENDVASMAHIDELVIPAQSSVTLKPQGLHLMLMNPERNYPEGEQINIVLKAEDGAQFQHTITVQQGAK